MQNVSYFNILFHLWFVSWIVAISPNWLKKFESFSLLWLIFYEYNNKVEPMNILLGFYMLCFFERLLNVMIESSCFFLTYEIHDDILFQLFVEMWPKTQEKKPFLQWVWFQILNTLHAYLFLLLCIVEIHWEVIESSQCVFQIIFFDMM